MGKQCTNDVKCCKIMSTREKQATPKAAFVFLVPLANEQPAKQAGKRVSAGTRADESTKEKQATQKGI